MLQESYLIVDTVISISKIVVEYIHVDRSGVNVYWIRMKL